ncbi:MAG: hypothetical protein Q9163_005150 [Psora crenata]
MKFLRRSKSRQKCNDDGPPLSAIFDNSASFNASFPLNPTADFPRKLLEDVLSFVCPHAREGSHGPSEELVDGGCMLCDMRDLAQCALVNRQWCEAARKLLEAELVVCRRRRSFNGRLGDSRDPAQERLQIFANTVRENNRLGQQVRSLKTPYMTRETCRADLARTVSVLPNLQYVDLPEGFFNDSASSSTLKHELQARCPNLRRMKYAAGSEGSFADLAQAKHWRLLEDLEFCRLGTDTATLVRVLASLPALRAVEMSDLPLFDDDAFIASSPNSSLPPLSKLTIKDLRNISTNGLITYLSRPDVAQTMTSLTISNTSIEPSSLHSVLASCPKLRQVHLSENISRPFPTTPIPLLASQSLQTLNYEISAPALNQHNAKHPAESYYSYLARSVIQGSLPALRQLYALSTSLPTMLLQPSATEPADPSLSTTPPSSRTAHFNCQLNLYTKTVAELEWHLTAIGTDSRNTHSMSSIGTRPVSLYREPQVSPQWRDKGRESVMVGNGFGGFLTVPSQDGGTRNPGKRLSRKERDAWMG